ncbi:MAG: NAD-dependent epimerase/dehydratase family protein, partial [Limisphaerales bacterium]
MNKLLVTGSSGLIGSEVVEYFCKLGWNVHGVDNNMRADFFGPGGDTRWNQKRILTAHNNFRHHELDIRDRVGVDQIVSSVKPIMLVHAAA